MCEEVQYLGHIITPQRIKPNRDRITVVQDYPVPTSVREVRQFVGLISYVNSAPLYVTCERSGGLHLVEPGLTAGSPAVWQTKFGREA